MRRWHLSAWKMSLANAFPRQFSSCLASFSIFGQGLARFGNQSWNMLAINNWIWNRNRIWICYMCTCLYGSSSSAGAANKWQFVVDFSSIIQNIWFTFASCRIWHVLLGFVSGLRDSKWSWGNRSSFDLALERFFLAHPDIQAYIWHHSSDLFLCGLRSPHLHYPITKLGPLINTFWTSPSSTAWSAIKMLADIELKPKNKRNTKRSRQTTDKVMNIVTTWLPLLVGEWQWAEDRCRRLWSDHFAEANPLQAGYNNNNNNNNGA